MVALLFAACHFEASCGKKSLNMDRAKEFVSSALERNVGTKPDSVECPASVKGEKGATFSCEAKFGEAVATVTIVQDDDQGAVTIQSVTGLLIPAKAAAMVADMVGKRTNTHVTASCGDHVRPSTPGSKFTCEAKDETGATYVVEVDVQDASGNVKMKLLPTPGAAGEAN